MKGAKVPRVRRADDIDRQVGENVRTARQQAGMSQVTLANAIGVTYQQMMKYESGQNRLSPSRLFRLAHALGQEGNVQSFFAGCTLAGADRRKTARGLNGHTVPSKELLVLNRNYCGLPQGTRDAIRALVGNLRQTEPEHAG
jgi:transcriptional regulator with XRE-family HTH domain